MVIGMQRYFACNRNLEISDDDKYHIIKVMRMKKGDQIQIVWDKDTFFCEIDEIDNKNVKYNILEKSTENNELPVNVTLVFSLVNEVKTDYILQKGTELGISEFIPMISERSKVKINDKEKKKVERWNKITKEAAEQSYRNIIPKVTNINSLNSMVLQEYDLKLVCSTKEKEKTIKNVLQNSTKYDNIIIVVGPEGGLTEKEEDFLNKNGFISVSLGKSILRTETAPLFALSAIRYEFMR